MTTATLDKRDASMLAARMRRYDALTAPRVGALPPPRVGDYVRFACGTLRRISYLWPDGAQTSDENAGRFYLGDGYVSFSGTLHSLVPDSSLVLTRERRSGAVWFFHHDAPGAGRGVYASATFRVFTCDLDAPS